MLDVVSRVGQFLSRLDLSGGPLVVAVSGGPDSVALLQAAIRQEATARPGVVVAHFNHQLRGEESDADEAFVRGLHAKLALRGDRQLSFRSGRADVRQRRADEHRNLESRARQVRYAWLADMARETGARFVATGHTADDQAETVLMRLLRGTGLRGLGGIAARRPLAPGVEVVRPLLTTTRPEVLAFLAELGQDYRHDRSNDDRTLTRNRVRQELLPHLASEYNPAIASVLCRLAEQAAEAYREQEAAAQTLLTDAELPRAGRLLVFRQDRLGQAPRHLVREAFRLAWARERWPQAGMRFAEWDRLAGLACGEEKAADLPGGIRARRRGPVVQLGPVR